jgi:hypothetical protein
LLLSLCTCCVTRWESKGRPVNPGTSTTDSNFGFYQLAFNQSQKTGRVAHEHCSRQTRHEWNFGLDTCTAAKPSSRSRDERAAGSSGLAGKLLWARGHQGSARGEDVADRRHAAHGALGSLGPEDPANRGYCVSHGRCAAGAWILSNQQVLSQSQ